MPVALSYPGVYIEEIPSGVRTIVGVATSVTAFVGYTARGDTDKAVQIFNYGDFERAFGGLDQDSDVSYAVQHFFLNGGSTAWIVRVASGARQAGIGLKHGVDATAMEVLTVTAKSEGIWGNSLRLDVDYDTANPASLFNLTVAELVDSGGVMQTARSEVHRNLSMNSFSPAYACNVINAESELIEVSRPLGAVTSMPGTSTSGALTLDDLARLNDDRRSLAITIDGDGPHEFDIFDVGGSLAGASLLEKLNDLSKRIAAKVNKLRPSRAFAEFTCKASPNTIVATSGPPENGKEDRSAVRFSNATQRNAAAILKLGTANGGSEVEGAAAIRPTQTGTVGNSLALPDLKTLPQPASVTVTVKIEGLDDDGPYTVSLWDATGRPTSLEDLRSRVQTALSRVRTTLGASPAALSQAQVTLVDSRLRIVAGGSNPNAWLQINDDSGTTAAHLIGLAGGTETENVARYALGVGDTSKAQSSPVMGSDGSSPSSNDLRGDPDGKTGLYALEDVDIFNILTLPDISEMSGADASPVWEEALAYAKKRRAFLIVDMPSDVHDLKKAKEWLSTNGSLKDENAAVYFPRLKAPDPLENNRLRSFTNSGAVAGLFARIDSARGVWKAPAGTEAVLSGVQALDYVLTDPENGVLNPLGINCLRNMPAFGPVVWGARTLQGSDQLASEWKYIPVRRLALFIEESLYRGTQWVVFEPNDEPLWAQIRLNIGSFMQNLFRQGAFRGKTPQEAYFVKCDKETTTPNDVDLGIVNIIVGFAPLKPAEFVIIKLQQIAGEIRT